LELTSLHHPIIIEQDTKNLEGTVSEPIPSTQSPCHPTVICSMATLASIYAEQGKFDKALIVQDAVVSQQQLTLGPDNPTTLESLNDLALLYFSSGDFAAAEQIQTQTYKEHQGEKTENPETFVIAIFNLALTKKELGKSGEATRLMEEARDVSQEELGRRHPRSVEISDTLREWNKEDTDTESIRSRSSGMSIGNHPGVRSRIINKR